MRSRFTPFLAWDRGIKSAIAKVLTTDTDYEDFFTKEVENDILEDMPDFVKEALNPLLLSTLVSFSILYMFLPDYQKKKKFNKVTFKNLQTFINESRDPKKPRISVPKKFQPYILRDLPRKVKENLPVPNWKKDQVYKTFKHISPGKTDEARQMIADAINEGMDEATLTKKLADKFGIKKENAQLMAETEIRRARHWAYNKIGKQLGYTQKIFRSYWERCPLCASLDRRIFPIETNVIPDMTHPRCNCSTFIIPSSKKAQTS